MTAEQNNPVPDALDNAPEKLLSTLSVIFPEGYDDVSSPIVYRRIDETSGDLQLHASASRYFVMYARPGEPLSFFDVAKTDGFSRQQIDKDIYGAKTELENISSLEVALRLNGIIEASRPEKFIDKLRRHAGMLAIGK